MAGLLVYSCTGNLSPLFLVLRLGSGRCFHTPPPLAPWQRPPLVHKPHAGYGTNLPHTAVWGGPPGFKCRHVEKNEGLLEQGPLVGDKLFLLYTNPYSLL